MTHKLIRAWILQPNEYAIKKNMLIAPMSASTDTMMLDHRVDVGSYVICEEEVMIVMQTQSEHEHIVVRAFNSEPKWHVSQSVVWYALPANAEQPPHSELTGTPQPATSDTR